MLKELAYLSEPVFAFTCDLDWAPEEATAELLALLDEYSVPLTPFVTHHSPSVQRRFDSPDFRPRVGLHPNFFIQSTHGVNETEVLDTACSIWPEAKGFRAHGFFDNANLTLAVRDRGFQWDSNLLLLLQEGLVPLAHFSGLVRFPVFWDDFVHVHKRLPFDLSETAPLFTTPGLKVINTHPLLVALNTPSPEHYARSKGGSLEHGRFDGAGVGTLLRQLLDFVQDRSFRTAYLQDLFVEYDESDEAGQRLRQMPWQWTPDFEPPRQRGRAEAYKAASDDEKLAIMQAEFDSRDPCDVCATSADVNLRELGIRFVSEHLGEGRVLELGCGNGHVLISLARTMKADMVGMDLSAAMVAGARALARQAGSGVKGTLHFQQGDVRSLPFDSDSFDYVISQGCIVTLPTREDQWKTIREVHRVLTNGGVYIMIEGTEDGSRRLNRCRQAVGLPPFPSVTDANFSSLKFEEEELRRFLADLFVTEDVRYFGAYYLISKVLHPLLAHPQPPSFPASINGKAREIDQVLTDCGQVGTLVGCKLVAQKGGSISAQAARLPNQS
jgi:SAM-dependent methyltransferase